MKPTIVFLDTDTLELPESLKELHSIGNLILYSCTLPDQTIDRSRQADVIITNKVVISKDVIEACSNLKLICIAATGMNNVDVEYAEKKGIVVKNAVGYSTNSVAQCTFALLFELIHRVSYYDAFVKSGAYSQQPIFTHIGKGFEELTNKKFGIIGLGNIGRKVAEIATIFGARVSYFSTSGVKREEKYPSETLEQLLSTSDIVSIHAPLNERTKGLIRYKELKMMKPTSYLLNMGRGGIIVERDLYQVLEEGHLAGVALDVFEREPIDMHHPFLTIKSRERLLLTPHIAWTSLQARQRLVQIMIDHIRYFFKK
ncbi:MAG: D-2-hydroxyacid dehydrogenase [Cytophagales bacterium]|nr:D-2-hydroxyacid dehydrogenase [Cytophagales bacterium]MDW8384950.1 D-2-hydroxyacid dehydrogenase [Flammeovirgaceae bacterium]